MGSVIAGVVELIDRLSRFAFNFDSSAPIAGGYNLLAIFDRDAESELTRRYSQRVNKLYPPAMGACSASSKLKLSWLLPHCSQK